jgi:hypothetical protein
MSIKINRATQGPGWGEVILGAALSAVLGVAIAAVLLVFRPVNAVPAMPKEAERDPHAVYYVEGSRDGSRGAQAMAKRKAFAEGQSVTVGENELNALAGMPAGLLVPKVGDNAKPADKSAPAATSSEGSLATGVPNFRLHDGALQIGLPVSLNVLGLNRKLIVQTLGGFVKKGDGFVYEPSIFYVGSCPVQRLPFLAHYLRGRFVAAQAIPEDIKASWAKLANVSIEGNALKLTMP